MRKKSGTVRDEFTDALNEEILSRKIFDKAKPSDDENIFLSETENKSVVEPEIKTFKSKKKIKKSLPKIPEEKILPQEVETVEKVEAKNDFEERIFAEAENDFYEEKVPEIGKHMRLKVEEKKSLAPIFHSKKFENDVHDPEEENLPPPDPELYRKLSRTETVGAALSAIMLVYSFANLDKPLFFMALSLLSHLLRPLIGGFFGKHNRAVQNALRSFGIVLFFGALLFLFM